jgi:hypothetical protein
VIRTRVLSNQHGTSFRAQYRRWFIWHDYQHTTLSGRRTYFVYPTEEMAQEACDSARYRLNLRRKTGWSVL